MCGCVACTQAALWELLMLIHCEAPLLFSGERMSPAAHCLEIQLTANVVAATACDTCMSVRGYHLAEGCKPPLGNCFSFGPWIMPFGDSNPFCLQSLTHNWWVCVGWDRTAADLDACCHCSSPLVHLALGHLVSFQCSSISILTAESKLIMLTSLFKNVCKEKYYIP